MRIRTTILAAAVAALPVIALAQTVAPAAPPAAEAPVATPAKPHHDRAARQKFHAERRAKYAALNTEDKAKYDGLTKQIRELRHQQMQMLGIGKS